MGGAGNKGMPQTGLRRIAETGTFTWPWSACRGLAVLCGAAGGGGGGGGAFCMQGLNLHGAAGGDGGNGGSGTTLQIGHRCYNVAGGSGGGGGGGGGISNDGKPVRGPNGRGCHFGLSDGGTGARVAKNADRVVADGGDGGRGFPGETAIVELSELSVGDVCTITVGRGGDGGHGGEGFETGSDGVSGIDGHVLLVPVDDKEEERVR